MALSDDWQSDFELMHYVGTRQQGKRPLSEDLRKIVHEDANKATRL